MKRECSGKHSNKETGQDVDAKWQNAGLSVEGTPSRILYTLAPLMATRRGVVTARQSEIIVLVLCNKP